MIVDHARELQRYPVTPHDGDSDPTLRITEVFGPTIQGEGPAAGQRAVFLRLAGCPFACTWCDTRYSWNPTAYLPGLRPHSRSTDDLAERIRRLALPSDLIVVTGGEPLVQQAALRHLTRELVPTHPRLHLETAGTAQPDLDLLDDFETIVVSPKLPNAGLVASTRLRTDDFRPFAERTNTWFKFVVTDQSDFDQVGLFRDRLDLERVMVMAEGSSASESLELTRRLAGEAIARGWSVSPRLHIWLWGDEPGR